MLFRNILLAYCKAILHVFPKIMLYFLPQVEGEGGQGLGGGQGSGAYYIKLGRGTVGHEVKKGLIWRGHKSG